MQEIYEIEFDRLVRQITAYNPKLDVDFLKKAYCFSYDEHIGQLRKSGEPYFQHCLEVAAILASLRLDAATIASGLLHDVVEDNETMLQDIDQKFGAEVAGLVAGVAGIRHLKTPGANGKTDERYVENYSKMLLSVVRDIRVVLIKLADRLHNMRTLKYLPEKKQREIAVETREIYVPLANRLGLSRLKSELEDFVFKFLNNEEYKKLARKINEKRQQREQYIQSLVDTIAAHLSTNAIKAGIEGRPKSLFSIYKKSQNRNLAFEEMYDLFAIRIIVEKLEDCYQALNVVHGNFEHRQDKFYDYIARPKSNGYQSLHTVIFGKENKLVEVQIRTEAMHRIAEDGIAAHWKYKEGKLEDNHLDKYLVDFRQYLRQLAESLQNAKDEPREVLEHFKIDLFKDEIFVYTPRGEVVSLPGGSTPLDFAFAVHTDVGIHCLGAKVNGNMAPLQYKLKSGETVEIITSANQKPAIDWVNFVCTPRAYTKIKRWFKNSMREQSQKLGEMIIHDAFRKILDKASPFENGVRVQGLDNVLVHLAKCCHPVSGDRILGFITKGNGVIVHRSSCKNILKLMENSEGNLEGYWDLERDKNFLVRLQMLGHDRINFLHEVSAIVAQTHTNIVSVNMHAQDSCIQGHLVIEIKNLLHLTQVINKISKVNGIINVDRLDGAGEPVVAH